MLPAVRWRSSVCSGYGRGIVERYDGVNAQYGPGQPRRRYLCPAGGAERGVAANLPPARDAGCAFPVAPVEYGGEQRPTPDHQSMQVVASHLAPVAIGR